jgi:hypothetical protein
MMESTSDSKGQVSRQSKPILGLLKGSFTWIKTSVKSITSQMCIFCTTFEE